MAESTGDSPKRKNGPGRPWKKGQSGNPGGRSPIIKHIQELARQHTEEALQALIDVMRMPAAKQPSAKVKAAEIILNRAWGCAPKTVEVTGKDGGPIQYENAKAELDAMLTAMHEAANGDDKETPSEKKAA